MNPLKNFKPTLLALVVAGTFTACSDDDPAPELNDGTGRLGIYASANYSPTGDRNNATSATVVELSRFLVNFEEIELEYDEIFEDDPYYDSDDDIELKGPFEVDMLSPDPVEILNIAVPNGRLEEIEFEFDKSEDPDSDLFKKSMLMDGTINGVPFVFWHDFEDEIELEFDEDNGNSLIINDENNILISFNLNGVLDPTLGVDLSEAVDGNGDGIIEISPVDPDGNQALAAAMKRAIKNQIELLEDLYD